MHSFRISYCNWPTSQYTIFYFNGSGAGAAGGRWRGIRIQRYRKEQGLGHFLGQVVLGTQCKHNVEAQMMVKRVYNTVIPSRQKQLCLLSRWLFLPVCLGWSPRKEKLKISHFAPTVLLLPMVQRLNAVHQPWNIVFCIFMKTSCRQCSLNSKKLYSKI